MIPEDAIGTTGAALLRHFAGAAAQAFPGLVDQVALLLPARPAPDFPHQVAVVLRMEPGTREEEKAALREARAKLERAALPATTEGHAIMVFVVPSYDRDWLSRQSPDQAIAVELGTQAR